MKNNPPVANLLIKGSVFVGVLAYTLGIMLWLFFLLYNPYSPEDPIKTAPYSGIIMVIFCLIGIVVSIKKKPVFLLLISLLSFIPIGLYSLGAPNLFMFIGLLNIFCIVAAISLYIGMKFEHVET